MDYSSFLKLFQRHPLLYASVACLSSMMVIKLGSYFFLKARVPEPEQDILSSLPQPQHPPLRTSKSAAAHLGSIAEEQGEAASLLLDQIFHSRSLSNLCSEGGEAASSPSAALAGSPGLGLPLEGGGSGSPRSARSPPSSAAPLPWDKLLGFLEHSQIHRLGETLSIHHKIVLHSLVVPRTLAKGEVLMQCGEDARDGLFLVTSGRFGVQAPGAEEPLCVFEAGTSLGENALIAGVIPATSATPSAGGQLWMPSFLATRPSTVVALEDSSVVALSAASFADFCLTYPEAGATIILESTCRQWRVAHTLLVEYFLLKEARLAALEPPGTYPAFSFSPGPGGLWGVAATAAAPSAAAAAAPPPFPPPIAMPLADLEAAADAILTVSPGQVVYTQGTPCDALYCILAGWAATTSQDSQESPRTGAGLQHCADFPVASLRPPLAASPRAHAYLRLIGKGCLSGGPACLNTLLHRETLTAAGSTPLRLAVFRRSTFVALARAKSQWGGGRQGGAADGAAAGGFPPTASSYASAGSLSTPTSTPRPSMQTLHPSHTALSRPAVHLFLALAVARSMVALPRMLLSLGIRRQWKACGEAIFLEGEASNGMWFITSGRVRCETKPLSRPASLPHFAPLRASAGAGAATAATAAATTAATAAAAHQLPVQQQSFALHVDVSAGGTVGELSVLSKEARRSSTAVAARDCELVHISAPAFAILTSRFASVHEHFTASLARRVSETTQALMQGRGGWGASSGAPGLLGVEKSVGIPFSLPAPPPPTLTFGGRTQSARGKGSHSRAPGAAEHAPPPLGSPQGPPDTATLHSSSPLLEHYLPPSPPLTSKAAWAVSHPSLVPIHPCAPSFSTLTLLPCGAAGLQPGVILALARQLCAALAATEGGTVTLARRCAMEESLGEGAASSGLSLQYGRARASAWLGSIEEHSTFTVLVAEEDAPVDHAWARLCVQHSDIVLLVGAGGGAPSLGELEDKLQLSQTLARVDLCLLQPEGRPPTNTRAWFSGQVAGAEGAAAAAAAAAAPWQRQITQHHHIWVHPGNAKRLGAQGLADVSRLSRFLTGRAIGVVLGGGGSRGLAHFGLIKELVERGIPIDVIGGASQGAYMGAAWAITESLEAMAAKMATLAGGVGSTLNILTALTLPLVSWTSGAHFDDLIRGALGSVQIEDLPGPRFFAVSLNVTDGAMAVHAVGPLWRYVRASMGVIKLLPPVFDKETKRLLCDGGYVSNLPVDVLHGLLPGSVGLTFACDVENKDSTRNWLDISDGDYGKGDSVELSGWWVAWRWLLASVGLGPPIRIPWTDEIFLQVSYMMHYSSLRNLLSEEGYDGAMKEAVDSEEAGPEHSEVAAAAESEAEVRNLGRPHLCYVRPKVGKFTLLQYNAMDEIVKVGLVAAKLQLDKWERRWRAPV